MYCFNAIRHEKWHKNFGAPQKEGKQKNKIGLSQFKRYFDFSQPFLVLPACAEFSLPLLYWFTRSYKFSCHPLVCAHIHGYISIYLYTLDSVYFVLEFERNMCNLLQQQRWNSFFLFVLFMAKFNETYVNLQKILSSFDVLWC